MKWFDGITNSVDMKLSKLWEWRTEEPGVLQSMGSQRVGHDLATEHTHKISTLTFATFCLQHHVKWWPNWLYRACYRLTSPHICSYSNQARPL